jgi:hypothetical protein
MLEQIEYSLTNSYLESKWAGFYPNPVMWEFYAASKAAITMPEFSITHSRGLHK